MKIEIERPTDNYDPRWVEYWAAHPGEMRSVGAAVAEGAAGAGAAAGAGGDAAAAAAAAAAGKNGADDGAGGAGAGGAGAGDAGKAGAGAVSWRDSFTDPELRKHAERFTTPEELAKAHRGMRDQLAKAIVPPGKDAKPEEIAAYRKAIGVPEKPEEYKFATPAGREPTDGDKAFQGTMAKLFHGANISAEQAEKLNAGWNEYVDATMKAEAAADAKFAETATAELKAKWGADYDKNLAFANRAAAKIYGDRLTDARGIQTKDGRFVLDHPLMVEAFATIGREMGEDRIGPAMTDSEKQTIQQQIDDLQTKRVAAQSKGDSVTAQRLADEQRALYAKLDNSPIVGSQGRTV